jgi:uncharacterized protein
LEARINVTSAIYVRPLQFLLAWHNDVDGIPDVERYPGGQTASNDTKRAVANMLVSMLKKTLLVAISRVSAPASAIEPFVAEHPADMNALEAEGHLWASGPFIESGVLVGDGLTVLSTSTIEEAHRSLEEGLIERGLRTFELENASCERAEWISHGARRSASIRFDGSPAPKERSRATSLTANQPLFRRRQGHACDTVQVLWRSLGS